jgi:bacterioferritin
MKIESDARCKEAQIRCSLIYQRISQQKLHKVPSYSLQSMSMQGNPKVIALLNEALKEELTAINQYFLHAEMCENWHYDKLGAYIKKQSIDEMKHAEILIERILFLDGTPSMTKLLQLTVGQNVKAQLESDLNLEISAVGMYNRAVQVAREEGDNASRELFERLLKDEEEHVDWLEAQRHQIREMGYERYLSQQI